MKATVRKQGKALVKTLRGTPTGEFPLPDGMMVTMAEGLLGFEDIPQFRMSTHPHTRPFMFMQAAGDEGISFVCVNTYAVCPDYVLRLPWNLAERLEASHADDLAVMSLVTVGRTVQGTTANLMSPIIVNRHNGLGLQAVLDNSGYPVRYRIWEALNAGRKQEEQLACAAG